MTAEATTRDLLLIGIGNDLRSDDAAGRVVASRVEDLGLPGVRVRSVHQLLPELVEDLAECAHVVFVDADVQAQDVCTHPVTAAAAGTRMTHHCTPAGLLGLAETAGFPVPAAVAVSIPAHHFGVGTELSPDTAAGVQTAVDLVAALAHSRPA